MTEPQPNPDPTIRGRQVNVPLSTTPRPAPRHQPDTPINKKFATQKPPPKKRRPKTIKDLDPIPDQPPGENNNVPAPPG